LPALSSPYCRVLCLVLLVLAQILFICGCAVTTRMERPSQIPAFAPGDEKLMSCPRIAGRYMDKGEAFTVKGQSVGQVSLSQLLFGDNPAYAAADAVTMLEPESDVIDIHFFKEGQSLAVQRFSKYTWGKGWNWDHRVYSQPYYCVNGFLQIDRGAEHHGAQGLGMFVAGKGCLLRKAVDGSLIVLQRENSLGIVVIVPFGAKQDIWCHFSSISDDPAGANPR
jgi:hypothetical protein